MIIDAHVNITEDGKWFDTDHDASLERLLSEMGEARIDKCLLVSTPLATTNKYIASVIEKHPGKFGGLGHVDFTRNLTVEVDEIFAMGLDGVKIHPRIQGVGCNSPSLEPLFEHLNGKEALVMIDGYYQTKGSGVFLSDLEPFEYDRLAKKYPNIKFILSHMCGHKVFDAYFLAKSNPNLYLDNSHVLKYFENTSLTPNYLWVMDKLDQKVIYGSDFPEYSLGDYLRHFREITKNSTYNINTETIFTNIRKVTKL